VGLAFQPRKEVALKPSLFNRGWKAAPTGTPPILMLMALGPTFGMLTVISIDGFVKSQNFDFCSLQHFEITSPEILFLCFLRLFAAISVLRPEILW